MGGGGDCQEDIEVILVRKILQDDRIVHVIRLGKAFKTTLL